MRAGSYAGEDFLQNIYYGRHLACAAPVFAPTGLSVCAFHHNQPNKFAIMAGRVFFAALAVACSLTPAIASDELATVTAAPKTRHTSLSYHDLAERQPATTYETNSPLPLTQYQYPYSAVPEQVNPFAVGRGPQFGYNRCNSSTEGPTSNCQTLMVNSLVRCCPNVKWLWLFLTASNLG